MQKQQVDIAIVGAGIVGCTLASLLSKKLPHIKIALVDKQAPKPFSFDSDIGLRVYAINHASQALFEALGLWPRIQQRLCPYQHMTVWEQSDQALSFHAGDIGQGSLGHIIEHDVLHDTLYRHIQQNPSIELLCPAQVQSMHVDTRAAQLNLDSEITLQAKLVVAADGAHSAIRKLSDIVVNTNHYLQSAIVAVVETEKSHQNTAWQRFLPTGPLAFLPLQDGRSSIVWSLPQDQVDHLLAATEAEFIQLLTQQSQSPLGNITQVGERAKFALQQAQAADYVKPRLALVGDAAHVVHPLAGQGLNLGLNDVSLLLATLCEAHKQHADIGQHHILKRYARRSQLHNRLMAEAFGGLNSLFASDNLVLQAVRDNGFSLIEQAEPLKRFFIQQAIGKI